MRSLRVVGITEDGSVVLEDTARRERYTVPADEQLRAAARGDLTRLGQIAIELESQLRPREIQARIRAGASVDQVASAAGVPVQKIERFAYPVLLERARTAELAQAAHPAREDGPDVRTLAETVAHTFGLRGQEPGADWDSWKGEDGRWVVALGWRSGRSDIRAHWVFQPGAHGGTVTALDDHARDLVEGRPQQPLRPVGPVIDMARPEEPAPAPVEDVPAAVNGAVVHGDGPRIAPEQRRSSGTGVRRTPPRVEAAGAAWVESSPVETPRGEVSRADVGRAETGRAETAPSSEAVREHAPRAETVRTESMRAEAPPAEPVRDDAPRSGGSRAEETQVKASSADTPRAEVARDDAAQDSTAQDAAEPSEEPVATSAAEATAEPADTPAAAADEAPVEAEPVAEAAQVAEPAAEEPAAEKPNATEQPAATGESGAEATASAETAPEKAADEPAKPAARPRTKKGKPVMPSWDEVLLGVRGR
jgi:hypothetical protein